MTEKEAKAAAKAAEKEAKAAAKAAEASEETPENVAAPVLVRVFYRELHNGERTGAYAHKDFTSREDADMFAAEVGGRIAK